MDRILLLLCLLCCSAEAYAQKKVISHDDYARWIEIANEQISPDGRFVGYHMDSAQHLLMVVQAVGGVWRKELKGTVDEYFTLDSKHVFFSVNDDSLGLLKLGSNTVRWFDSVSTYKIPANGIRNCFAYKRKSEPGTVNLWNITSGTEERFLEVEDFTFSKNGRYLLLIKKLHDNGYSIICHDLEGNDGKTIWTGQGKPEINSFVFDKREEQLAFLVQELNSSTEIFSLWHCGLAGEAASLYVDQTINGRKTGWYICREKPAFSADGKMLFFYTLPFKETAVNKAPQAVANVDIWHYRDFRLQSQQLAEAGLDEYSVAAINKEDRNIIFLQQADEEVIDIADVINKQFFITRVQKGSLFEENWQSVARPSYFLVNKPTGERRLLDSSSFKVLMTISPASRYVLWYDRILKHYFTYNILTGAIRNITKDIDVPLYNIEDDHPGFPPAYGMMGWTEADESVLIYDKFDVWEVDAEGRKPPINVTNNYGRKNMLTFRYLNLNDDGPEGVFRKGRKYLFSAFDNENKNSGFFSKVLNRRADPEQLSLGPYNYDVRPCPYEELPQKYQQHIGENNYLVMRQSAVDAPNIFITKDFKNFTAITDYRPQAAYNWLSAQLMHWNLPDGRQAEGILYKPEDFDPAKKYPVIFYFYEKDSHDLNKYILPQPSNGRVNIAYFVSNGYLVFDPNIYYTIGHTGESALNSVVSAARFLSGMPWVDASKMALQGHSFGGYEVNYLVAHTNIFAAAASASGPSNLVSAYGGLSSQRSAQFLLETFQCRIGATLWEKPELFIKNSPVFDADKVNTPLLIMHNKGDDAVPFSQALEYFTALRRLNKPCWLLQYDDDSHQLDAPQSKLDYSIRLAQFFDYYLKGAPCPKWMLTGIPAKSKGILTGFELDTSGQLP
jgi:predicted peptidase